MIQLIKTPSPLDFSHLFCSECEGTRFHIKVDGKRSHIGNTRIVSLVCAECEHEILIHETTTKKEDTW